MYYIYCHVFPNGKRYIGITRLTPSKRWGNGRKYMSCPLMQRAINKYGWNSVEHVILGEAETIDEGKAMEKSFIDLYDTTNPDRGYNLLPGGDISENELTPEILHKLGNGQRGRARTETEKKAISEGVKKKFNRPESNGHYGLKHSEESKRKMSASQVKMWTEERRRMASERMKLRMTKGEFREKVLRVLATQPKRKQGEFHLSEHAKKKISENMKGRFVGANSPSSIPVNQFTIDGQFVARFESAGEAERKGLGNRREILKCCHHSYHVKTVKGYVWKFDDEINI